MIGHNISSSLEIQLQVKRNAKRWFENARIQFRKKSIAFVQNSIRKNVTYMWVCAF